MTAENFPIDSLEWEDALIDEALMLAYRDALRAHRLAGVPIVVVKDRVMAALPAEEVERELDAAASLARPAASPRREEKRDEH